MREIKFRAWDNVEFTMYFTGEEDLIVFMFDSNGIVADKIIPDDSIDGFHADRLDHLQYMQYTGLKDKNGREIYEGDILRHDFKGEDKEWDYALSVVKYDDNDYDYGGRCLGFDVNGFWGSNFYVIGNIFKNPEMLGDTK